MEIQTRLSRHNKFISAENIIAILSVSSDDSLHASLLSQSSVCVCVCVCVYIYMRGVGMCVWGERESGETEGDAERKRHRQR